MRPLIVLTLFLAGCAAGAMEFQPPDTSVVATTSPALPPPDLVPESGTAWFGMNLDWENDSVASVSERLGVTPSVWVQFAAFPLDDGGRTNLDAFVEQIAAVDGIGLITLEPHGGLETVTPEAAEELARLLDGYWRVHGTPTIVRFAHEMNGSWYPWGQQPEAYAEAFRMVADAVHAGAPASAMAWAPNEGSGYPFTGGAFAGTDEALDTNGDGELTGADDPYAPFWPGAEAVDWVGMSVYHWGIEYPWGENEMPVDGSFRALLTGRDADAPEGQESIPDFYATYAEAQARPMGIFETAALVNPAEPGPTEAEIKAAWWRQVTDPDIRDDFPRLAMLNWFEWHKEEVEVGSVIDWRLSADPDLARRLLAEVETGWLRFDGVTSE